MAHTCELCGNYCDCDGTDFVDSFQDDDCTCDCCDLDAEMCEVCKQHFEECECSEDVLEVYGIHKIGDRQNYE